MPSYALIRNRAYLLCECDMEVGAKPEVIRLLVAWLRRGQLYAPVCYALIENRACWAEEAAAWPL